jgi:excisionase family DNA binding protein
MNELLSLSRCARRLGVTQQWLRDEADEGRIPCLKAGNRYLFNPDAVEAALAKRATRSREGADNE